MKVKVKDNILFGEDCFRDLVLPTKEELASVEKGDLILVLQEVRQLSAGFWASSNDKANTHWLSKDRIVAIVEKAKGKKATFPDKVLGYSIDEIQDGLNYAKERGWASKEEKKPGIKDRIWGIFSKYSMNYSRPAMEEILAEVRELIEEERIKFSDMPGSMPSKLRDDIVFVRNKVLDLILEKLK